MHIDPRPEFLGQVLRVTNQKSGEVLGYDIENSREEDLTRFETASKIRFLNGSDTRENTRHHATTYFTKMLGSAKTIDVYGQYVCRRFPSTCAYKFEADRVPANGCDPPFNFDYGVTRSIVPLRAEDTRTLRAEMNALKKKNTNEDEASGFPGITDRTSFVAFLESEMCPHVEDDVVGTPFRKGYEEEWYPTLRNDGNVGVFRSVKNKKKLFLVAESALPYFVCDQMILLVRKNPENWTWGQWARAEETIRLEELSRKSVAEVRDRIVRRLVQTGTAEEAEDRMSREKLTTCLNKLRVDDDETTVSYDAELVRPQDWAKRSVVIKIFAEREKECGYALIKNRDCGGGTIQETIPAVVRAPSFEEAEDTVRRLFSTERRAVIVVDILKEIKD